MSQQPPSGRLSAAVTNADANTLVPGLTQSRKRRDSYALDASAPQRVSRARAASIIGQLDDVDVFIVTTLSHLRLATGRQLQRLCFGEGLSQARRTRRRLAHLSDQRVVTRLAGQVGGRRSGSAGYLYGLDVVGQLLIDPAGDRRRARMPGPAFVSHALLVTECYVRLVELSRRTNLELLEFQGEPSCWRPYPKIGGGTVTLKPDAFVRLGVGEYEDRWWWEVDNDTEHGPRLTAKAQLYVAYWRSGIETAHNTGVFPRTLWLVSNMRRVGQLTDALGKLPAEQWHLFQICTFDQLPDVLVRGAGDTRDVGHDRLEQRDERRDL